MADYINREAAIKAIDGLQDCFNGFSDTYDNACIIGVLEELPAADVEPVKHGRWTNPRYGVMAVLTKMCSCCGFINNSSGEWNYCPNCGARMDGDADADMGGKDNG